MPFFMHPDTSVHSFNLALVSSRIDYEVQSKMYCMLLHLFFYSIKFNLDLIDHAKKLYKEEYYR